MYRGYVEPDQLTRTNEKTNAYAEFEIALSRNDNKKNSKRQGIDILSD